MWRGWGWVALLWCGCASFPAVDFPSLPGPADFPDAEAVVLLDEERVDFEPGKNGLVQATVTTHRRLRGLRPLVLEPIVAEYSHAFSEVLSVRARIVREDGREVPIDFSARSDRPVFGSSVLYEDRRYVRVPVPPLPVGAVYDEEIVTRHFDTRPEVYTQFFADRWPVKRASLELSAPEGWTVRWSEAGLPGPFAPREAHAGGRVRWRVELDDQPALPDEPNRPAAYVLAPRVTARLETWTIDGKQDHAFETPAALSSWLEQEYRKQAASSPELRATVQTVVRDVPNEPGARAQALYEYVCRTIDYCAIEIGYGGWIPHAASDVQRLKYGDCKDKANYLRTLLAEAGVSSVPTLIYAHRGNPRPFALPSLGSNFNHAILAVDLPGGVVYADPTQRVVPFGALAPSDQAAPVLELRPGGADLKQTPESTATDNVDRQDLTLALDGAGQATGEVTRRTTGAVALAVKQRLLSGRALLDRWLAEALWLRAPAVSDTTPEPTSEFRDEATVHAHVALRQVTVTGASGDALLRPFEFLSSWALRFPDDRTTDVVASYASRNEQRVELHLPPGTRVVELPQPVSLETPVAAYELRWSTEGEVVVLQRSWTRKARVLPRASLAELNALAGKVAAAEHAAVVVRLPRGGAR